MEKNIKFADTTTHQVGEYTNVKGTTYKITFIRPDGIYGDEVEKPTCKLVGEYGNAYAIMGRVRSALKRAGQGSMVDEYIKKSTSGDYDNLLCTAMDYVDEESDEEDTDGDYFAGDEDEPDEGPEDSD
jgi:hypothetical protein